MHARAATSRSYDSARSAIPLWPSRFTPGKNHVEAHFLRTDHAPSGLLCGATWSHFRIVSDDQDSVIEPPAVASRRVSARLAVSVVVGCVALGWVVGVIRPLHPNVSSVQRVEESANLTLASAKLVENAPAAAQPRPSASLPVQPEHLDSVAAGHATPEPQALAPPLAAPVSTGSVDRSPSPGASESAVLVASDRQAAERSVPTAHLTGQRHQAARAKRLKRILWRRVRSKPPGMSIDAFFSSLVPKI